jgi:MFS family permease
MFFEFYFSTLAGRVGFKRMFKIGFLIPGIISIICFFLGNIYAILGLLVLASVGLAMLEPTTESYFFHTVGEKEVSRFYGPYNTTIEINDFLGKLLSATILIFLPFKYLFLFFGVAMFFFAFLSFKIKNVYEGVDGRKV